MGRDDVSISLVSLDCERAIQDCTEVPDMLAKAFKEARGHWMVVDEDPQMKGALNAVLKKVAEQPELTERLTQELRLIGQMNAWLHAAQMGVAGDVPTMPEGFEGFGVMKLWQESRT